MKTPWYRLHADEVLAALQTSRDRGLSAAEVAERRSGIGWNEIAFKKTPPGCVFCGNSPIRWSSSCW
jgi:magnesium-transporting ATPase (P-type)